MELVLQAIVIGVVQGLTEFLPISSSAHLIVLPRLLGWDDPFLNSAEFDVMLHLGTLAALLAYFWRDVGRLGLVAVLLVVGATLLFLAERFGGGRRPLDRLRLRDAVVVGAAQALALFPGISRSGITIAAGLAVGLEREAAARFAFLMGIPIIAGAGAWKVRAIVAGDAVAFDPIVLAAGVIASAIAGFVAIWALLAYLRSHSTAVFIAYRLGFAALVAAVFVFGPGAG
jgi:undecaprenyl-diphosphatase